MRAKSIAVRLVAAALLLAGAITLPAMAAEPSIPDNSASDSAPVERLAWDSTLASGLRSESGLGSGLSTASRTCWRLGW